MLKKLLFVIALTTYGAISAQTTVIDPNPLTPLPNGGGGFDLGATFGANGWTAFDQQTPFPFTFFNRWVANTGVTGYTGSRCAYITNDTDGTPAIPPFANSSQDTNNPKIYRDITFPAGENDITLSFDWKGDGDANDHMRVWLVPQAYAMSLNSGITATGTAPTGRIQLGGNFSGQPGPGWANFTTTIPSAYAGTNTYRLVIEWLNNGATGATPAAIDNISLVTQTVITYCAPDSTNNSDYINRFQTYVGGPLDIINAGSGYSTVPNNGYGDYTATDIVEQFPGDKINFAVQFGSATDTYGVNIWVDWDGDGDFLSNANEKVFATGTQTTSFTSDFTIPLSIVPGTYRMRVRADYLASDPSPCGSISYGEAEDYTLIVPAITCTDDPTNITISPIGIDTATINWDPAALVPAGGYEYFVTTNPNPISYNQTATGTTAATSVNLTGLIESTDYYVWVRSICSAGWGDSGAWQGPETFTTLVAPPTTTNVSICPGDPSQDLTADAACINGANLGNTITGTIDSSSPLADILYWFTVSTDPCAFDTSRAQQGYETFDFQVDVAGVYVFTMNDAVTPFDAMGYIVIAGFTPGNCGSGTYIAGDDDSAGTGLDAEITTTTLTPGTTYTLITTATGFGSNTGPFQWDVSGPGTLVDPYSTAGDMNWYTTAVGGASIFTGTDFDPVGVAGSGLTDTNTAGVYSYWAACSSSPNIRTQADFNIGKAWTGAVNADWNTGGNWSPSGVPTTMDCVVITNAATAPVLTATNAVGLRLIVQNGATLTQQSGSALTITDAITVDVGGTYNMLDSASLIQENNVANTVNGTFTMLRTANNVMANDYIYWSSPVTSFNVENISSGTPNGFKYQWQPTLTRPPGPPPTNVPNDYGDWQSANTGAMAVGKGYAVKAPTGHTGTSLTATFNGTPNNGIITQAIERGTHVGGDYTNTGSGGASLTVTSDDDNWNFIGNPYPSALHLEDFLYHPPNSNIDAAGYLWTHGTDIGANGQSFYEEFAYSYSGMDYIMVNGSGTSFPALFDGFIGAGQGFFVLMNDGGPSPAPPNSTNETIEFQNYMRDSSLRNDQFFRSTSDESTENKHRIWLDYVNPSGNTNTTLVAYVNNATNDKDRLYDAKTIKGEGLNLYSLINDDTYIIQGRQLPFADTDTVPLGINITEAGIQTIAINTLEGLFLDTDQDIYIEDLVTGNTHNIKNTPYTFTSEVGIINDRLVLRYTPSALSVDDFDSLNGIKVFEENENIVVKSDYETIQSIEVYDILGRNLFLNKSISSNQFVIESIDPKNATLFLKIKLVDGQQKIAKIIF